MKKNLSENMGGKTFLSENMLSKIYMGQASIVTLLKAKKEGRIFFLFLNTENLEHRTRVKIMPIKLYKWIQKISGLPLTKH